MAFKYVKISRRILYFNNSLPINIFYRMSTNSKMNVFDRQAKRKQRNRSALAENYKEYESIKEEVGFLLPDK